MQKLIGTLDAHKNRKTISEKLISIVLNNDLNLVIIVKKQNIINRYLNKSIFITKCKSSTLYYINNKEKIKAGINCLNRIRLWHKPVFYLLVVRNGTDNYLKDLCSKKKMSMEQIIQEISNDIECIIDPLDNQLEFYGSDLFKKTMTNNFQSFDSI